MQTQKWLKVYLYQPLYMPFVYTLVRKTLARIDVINNYFVNIAAIFLSSNYSMIQQLNSITIA